MTKSQVRPITLAVLLAFRGDSRCRGAEYFPAPDSAGGWRTLTDAGQIREKAGVDLNRMDEAFAFIQETSQNGGLLVVRHGYLIYEKYFGRGNREAHPEAINVTSSQTLHAALRGFAEAESDGIIQVSTGGAECLVGVHGQGHGLGSVAFAEYAKVVADAVPGPGRPAHRPLPEGQARRVHAAAGRVPVERVARGETPLFQSHMWDGSAVELEENLAIAEELLDRCARRKTIMEMEIGVVGGEEDGVVGEMNEKLYSTAEDAMAVARGARSGGTGPLPAGRDLRQRPRRLQARQRRAASRHPQGAAGRRRRQDRDRQARSTWSSTAVRARPGRDPRSARLRRREDEHRHRHPVRVHPSDRRPHVQQLRRRAEGRRRRRQQEGLRPSVVRQGGGAGDGRTCLVACQDLRSAGTKLS